MQIPAYNPIFPIPIGTQNRINPERETIQNLTEAIGKRALEQDNTEVKSKKSKFGTAQGSIFYFPLAQTVVLFNLLKKPGVKLVDFYSVAPFKHDLKLQNSQFVVSFLIDLVKLNHNPLIYPHLLIFLNRSQNDYQPSPEAEKFISSLFVKINYNTLSVYEILQGLEILEKYSGVYSEKETRYVMTDLAIQQWSTVLQALGRHTLNADELELLFNTLKNLMLAENFEMLWLNIENALEALLKPSLHSLDLKKGIEIVPAFFYNLATLQPQIRINKIFQELLFKFLLERNQRRHFFVSPMYSWGIFAHFTCPEQFPKLGKDFIICEAAKDQDFEFLVCNEPNFHNQFKKIVYLELDYLNAQIQEVNDEEFLVILKEFLNGFSLFGTCAKNYLTDESKIILHQLFGSCCQLLPSNVISFIQQSYLNPQPEASLLSADFAEAIIEALSSMQSADISWRPLIDLGALADKKIIPHLPKIYNKEINDLFKKTKLHKGVCETNLLILEALVLLARENIFHKLDNENIENIKSMLFSKNNKLLPFTPLQKVRLGRALLELHKTNPTIPIQWFTTPLSRFIEQRERVGSKVKF